MPGSTARAPATCWAIWPTSRTWAGISAACSTREVDYRCRVEWARTPADILEQRIKHGLHLNDEQKRALRLWLQRERPTVDA
jgi:glycerol-3-phosphate dehydrogenase